MQSRKHPVVILALLGCCSAFGQVSTISSQTRDIVCVGQVSLISPVDRAILYPDSVRFVWARPEGNPIGYELDIAVDSLFQFRLADSTLVDTTKVLSLSVWPYRVWWRVRAKSEYGWGEYSRTRWFGFPIEGVTPQRTVPAEFFLDQNYPNPFNPKTVISGQWTVDSWVRLVVYDLLGAEVAILADGRYPPGKYAFTFDGSNLSSGVYFYRLTAGRHSAARTMTLLK